MFTNPCIRHQIATWSARFSVRMASGPAPRKATDRIPIQLLQDIKGVGIRGEVLRVKPAYMRNDLHMGNRAAYILKGQAPPIPVVERPTPIAPVEAKPVEADAPVAVAMTVDELANLFGEIKSKRPTRVNFSASQEIDTSVPQAAFEISDLIESIPTVSSISLKDADQTVTKDYLSRMLYRSTGNQVDETYIRIAPENTKDASIPEITAPGNYFWIISLPLEKAICTKSLVVKA